LHQLLVDAPANRLITIVGPGGIGKSRLALEAAAAAAGHYPDGVYFVPLAALESAGHIVSILAESLDYRFWGSAEPSQQLLDFLTAKRLLLVTDNFEHVLEGAGLAADIIRKAPEVKILATSRERLHLSGETVYSLSGMDYPNVNETVAGSGKIELMDFGAVQLLHHHAKMVRPDHIWEQDELRKMAKICQQVQGMPLAIVLAAGWLELLSLSEIAGEIALSLDILESETRDIPERQQSVRAAFNYSWKRLSAENQELFMKLAVFRGGFSRMAAPKVSGAGLRALRGLAEKSLIMATPSKSYEIHELLRQFIEEKLRESGSLDQTRNNHSAYYLSAVAAREADLKGGRQLEALVEIEEDLENVRAAWNWAVNCYQWDKVNSCVEALYLFFDMRSRSQEGVEFFEMALSNDRGDRSELLKGRLLARQNWLRTRFSTDSPEIGAAANQCLAIAEENNNLSEIAFAKLLLGYFWSTVMTESTAAIPFFEDSLDIYQGLEDPFHTSRNLNRLGYCYGSREGMDKFVAFTRKSLDLSVEIGDMFEASNALGNLGSASLGLGDYARAKEYLLEASALGNEIGDRINMGHSSAQLGVYYLLQGDFNPAQENGLSALSIANDTGFKITTAYALAVLGSHAGLSGDYILADQLGRQSQDIPSNLFGNINGSWTLAIALTGLKDDQQARGHITTGVDFCMRFNWPGTLLWFIPIEAIILAREGRSAKAVQLLSLGYNHPLSAQGWIDRWDLIALAKEELSNTLGPDLFDENWQLGQELDLESTAAEILASAQ
jgi:predicted ATPase